MSGLDKYSREMEKICPKELGFSLFCLRDFSNSYVNGNHMGRFCLHYVWPKFFRQFPLGQIWLIETSEKWNDKIWSGQKTLAQETGYLEDNPTGFSAHEMSGLNIDQFHFNALNVLSYGIYPLITLCFCPTTLWFNPPVYSR